MDKLDIIKHNKWSFETKKNKYTFKVDAENNSFKFDDLLHTDPVYTLDDYRKASVIHRIVREKTNDILKPNVSYLDIADFVETNVKKYTNANGGMAFPVGISVNEIIAHDTALIGDIRYLKPNDIVKIDIGVHINGKIIDSAFTKIIDCENSLDHKYAPLLEATKDAVYSAISQSGVDKSLYELSETIYEVIESYEIDLTKISAVNGLGGHNILPYIVHGDKLILSKPHEIQKSMKMADNEIYAIETFASTGSGIISKVSDYNNWSHFGIDKRITDISSLKQKELNNPVLLWSINNHNLPFTQRWINGVKNWDRFLKEGISYQNIIAFPPLKDKKGTYTSQFEHTIHIKEGGVEILSLGNDY